MLQNIVVDLGSKNSTLSLFPLSNLAKIHSRLLGLVISSIYLSSTFAFAARSYTKRTTFKHLSEFACWLEMVALGILNTLGLASESLTRKAMKKHGKKTIRAAAKKGRRRCDKELEFEIWMSWTRWKDKRAESVRRKAA